MKDELKKKAELNQELTGWCRPIDQLESIDKEHRLTRDYLENVLENSPNVIGIVDRQGKFIKWNRMAEELYGYTFQELRGKSSFDLYADPDALHGMITRLRSEGSVKNYEIDMKRKDGAIIPCEVSITLLRDNDGVLTGSVCVARDLSDLRKALNALEKTNAKLQKEVAERRQIEESLRDSEAKLRLLSYQLLSAQEEERKRIAAELHDSIGASLGAVKFSMENALAQMQKGEAVSEPIHYSIRAIQHAIEEVRRIYMDLRPSLLDDLGLLATIDWFCRQFQTIHSHIFIEKTVEIGEHEIPEPLKIVMFRVVQEAFHNIAKYSKAEWVNLSITKTDDEIHLMIKDHGIGFDLGSAHCNGGSRKGLGLISMRERVELSGGSCGIESIIGEGTVVRASWTSPS